MRYISLFSGIGGLEHANVPPVILCEKDLLCRHVLANRFPGVPLHDDVQTLVGISADVVVGGWPCQDITVAGRMVGISGSRSSLFFSMLEVAARSGAHTIVGENVPALLTINDGKDFDMVLSTLADRGYPFVSWRTLNAREFGLPQERRRVFMIASKHQCVARSLHTSIHPAEGPQVRPEGDAAAFYWTAGGKRSVCYCKGYTPTIKVGAGDSSGRSTIAVFYKDTVRKLTAREAVSLQGFEYACFSGLPDAAVQRMAGNAVTRPVGNAVLGAVAKSLGAQASALDSSTFCGFGAVSSSGFYDGKMLWMVAEEDHGLSFNLAEFLDMTSTESLTPQACAGLLCRQMEARKRIPLELFDLLVSISNKPQAAIRGTRSNSFAKLKTEFDTRAYREWLLRQPNTEIADPPDDNCPLFEGQ